MVYSTLNFWTSKQLLSHSLVESVTYRTSHRLYSDYDVLYSTYEVMLKLTDSNSYLHLYLYFIFLFFYSWLTITLLATKRNNPTINIVLDKPSMDRIFNLVLWTTNYIHLAKFHYIDFSWKLFLISVWLLSQYLLYQL